MKTRKRLVLLSPRDPVLFSERCGYRKVIFSLFGWRLIDNGKEDRP